MASPTAAKVTPAPDFAPPLPSLPSFATASMVLPPSAFPVTPIASEERTVPPEKAPAAIATTTATTAHPSTPAAIRFIIDVSHRGRTTSRSGRDRAGARAGATADERRPVRSAAAAQHRHR